MKKILVSVVGVVFFATPALALVASTDDLNAQYGHLLAQVAALTADQPVSCTILTSKQHVQVGEAFTFMWYSTGMRAQVPGPNGNAWDPSGSIAMKLSKPGTWTYTLKFYGPSGEVPCTTAIIVSA